MTNETTASQPKRIGDDAMAQRDHYHERADDLAGAIASYLGADIGEHSSDNCPWANAIEALDLADPYDRAPAAQASATIQAAHPDDLAVQAFADAMKAKMAKSRAKGRGGWEECHAGDLRRMLVDHMAKGDPVDVGNFAMMLWNRGESTAATIQEPVMVAEPSAAQFKMPGETWEECSIDEEDSMRARGYKFRYLYTLAAPMVAEPVAYADPKAFQNFVAGTATNEWMWAKPAAGLVPVYCAAPMVADPAGVALYQAAKVFYNATVADPVVRISTDIEAKRDFASDAADKLRAALQAFKDSGAATVKAVPSEALDAKQFRADEWRAVAAYLESQQGVLPEEMKTVRLCATVIRKVAQSHLFDFAAQLADKTGGGE